ncbi:glycosyltransferase family 2 protein [Rhodoferax ferrireducens]|uniref:glycosyltransferase family 2 protein n=1 Tax=Rhodoferax ferrireducens TaxID=192843 RepID=UPI000E0D191A|nr:glycosyltransferase family 2 protein [Rhodoferax ferrireducens]
MTNLHLSVVIPVYKSAATLKELHQRISATLDAEKIPFELILVEDCGGDDSWLVIEEIAAIDTRVRGFQLSRNFGQHAATICGFTQSRGDWVVTMDDDLEQIPEHLPKLISKAAEGYDLVYGIYAERNHKAWRNISSSIARWLFNKAIPSLNYTYTSYRVVRGDIARALSQFDSPFPFVDGYLSWLTGRYASVEVPHGTRLQGVSNYTLKKLFTHTVNIFVTFSDLPLRMATWLGLGAFMFGVIWMLAILVRYALGGVSVSGFTSIMVGTLMFGGVQLLMLGIFGEYLGRMNFKSSKKPLYLIGKRASRDE